MSKIYKEFINSTAENKQSDLKMDKGPEQTFLKIRNNKWPTST